jgi:mannitol-1-phosphate/altronate dehydrogenase
MADEGIAALTELFHKDLGVILGEERMAKYGAKIRTRFADSAPMDTLRRVGARGTSKASERILFAVERAHKLSDGKRILKAPTFVAACWLLNLGNTDEFGHHFQQDDVELPKLTEVYQAVLNLTRSAEPQAHELAHILRKTGESVRDNRFVQMAGVDAFVQELLWALTNITKFGTSTAIAFLLARESESAAAAAQLARESESAAVVSK